MLPGDTIGAKPELLAAAVDLVLFPDEAFDDPWNVGRGAGMSILVPLVGVGGLGR